MRTYWLLAGLLLGGVLSLSTMAAEKEKVLANVKSPGGSKSPGDAESRAYLALGPHTVAVTDQFMLHDPSRDAGLPLRVYFPADGGPYPVIVFSHGAGDSCEAAPHLMRHWTSHGYVCVLPTHFYNPDALLQRNVKRLIEEMQLPIKYGPTIWHVRVHDITLIFDNLANLPKLQPELAGKLDTKCIGMAGHSYGAFTTVLLAGGVLTDPTTGAHIEYGDPRPKAFLLLSGQGHDPLGLTQDSWKNIHRPMLVVGGTRDVSPYLDSGEWRIEPYKYSPPGDKYSLYIYGANHLSYIGPIFDRPMRNPADRGPMTKAMRGARRSLAQLDGGLDQTGIFEYTRIATTAYWDAYLKNDTNAMTYLKSTALVGYSNHTLEWNWK